MREKRGRFYLILIWVETVASVGDVCPNLETSKLFTKILRESESKTLDFYCQNVLFDLRLFKLCSKEKPVLMPPQLVRKSNQGEVYQKEKGKGLFFGKIQYFSIFLCTHLLNTVYSYFREEKCQNATSIWLETSIVAQHPQGWAGIHKAALVANILCANFPKAAIIYRPNCQFMFQIG